MKITVIVPIHNSEKYLRECLQSVLSQTYKDLEILCIDGGSSDASPDIIAVQQKSDDRIVYISDSNTSYGHKINIGIDRAQGEYISILESDDKMVPDMLEKLHDIVEKYDVDIADADYYEFLEYKNREYRDVKNKYSNMGVYGHLINCLDEMDKEITSHGIWTALYKKDFLVEQEIRLNESEGASYQDTSFLFLTSLLAKSVYHLEEPLYQYRKDNIGSSVKDDRKIFEIVGEINYLKKELRKRGVYSSNIWRLYYIRKYNAFYWNYCRLSPNGREIFLEKYLEELRGDIIKERISKERIGEELYEQAFLLLNNKEEFLSKVAERERNISLTKIGGALEKIENKNIVVFGAGVWGTKIINILMQNDNKILGVCDNSRVVQGTSRGGYTVTSVEEAIMNFPDAVFLVVSYKYNEEMKKQLLENGIREGDIVLFQ